MQSKASTVRQYLDELPPERRAAIAAVRRVILSNLPTGYEEGMQYGMIGYHVPHARYPAGYHADPKQPLPFLALASQKNAMSLYLCCSLDPDLEAWFRKAWAQAGKKLDMGKSCVRFKRVEDLALDVLGESVRRMPVDQFVRLYEASLTRGRSGRRVSAKRSRAKRAAKSNVARRRKPTAKPKARTRHAAR